METKKPKVEIDARKLENFERAFSSRTSGCRRTCRCGREFWDRGNSGYDWEVGETEALEKDPSATPLGYSVGSVELPPYLARSLRSNWNRP